MSLLISWRLACTTIMTSPVKKTPGLINEVQPSPSISKSGSCPSKDTGWTAMSSYSQNIDTVGDDTFSFLTAKNLVVSPLFTFLF